jgi:hypothetical protein
VIYVVIAILLMTVVIWQRINTIFSALSGRLEALGNELKELKDRPEKPEPSPLPADWLKESWGGVPSREEERQPLENPNPLANPDAFTEARMVVELEGRPDPADRANFLTALQRAGAYFPVKLEDLIFKDKSPKVRVWAAANLRMVHKDYTDFENPVVIANYEARIKADPEPLVRASVWLNPNNEHLPWSFLRPTEDWKERLAGMTQLERLALMRNSDLSFRFILALLEEPTASLGMTRKEHADMLFAAATNIRIVWSSRHHGRDAWLSGDEGNPPFEEFGEMWKVSLDKWMDIPTVPYVFIRYVQTTPEAKLATYERLLKASQDIKPQHFRKFIIDGCDPVTDSKVLKRAWDDPDKDCKEAARERVGSFATWLGVKP